MTVRLIPPNAPTEPEKPLSLKQQSAALLLAKGVTIAKAAKELGINESSIDRWKKQPVFMAAVHHAEDDLYNEQLRALRKVAGAAIACLIRNMGEAKPYVQVSAASKLLDLGLQVQKVAELEARITELEELVKTPGRHTA
jgi:hypothetical protein